MDKYDTQDDYLAGVTAEAGARALDIERALATAFADLLELRQVHVIPLASISAEDLATRIETYPVILKPLIESCNVAARAIERDLGVRNLNTYAPKLDTKTCLVIAGYIKPKLPAVIELPTLVWMDRRAFIDKEVRKGKGRWEWEVRDAAIKAAGRPFGKRKFRVGTESFEIDVAAPRTGEIEWAIDVKRIEARRDIHKRCDEIVNKAAKFRETYSEGRFGVVIYYPFIEEHINIRERLRSPNIDGVVFAASDPDSIASALKMLVAMLKS